MDSSKTRLKTPLEKTGLRLVMVTLLLVSIGLIMVYAASALKGAQQLKDSYFFIRKQMTIAGIGFLGMFIVSKMPMKFIERAALPLLSVTLAVLLLIFVPGLYQSGGGAARWLSLGGIRFQTSELAKLALVFFLAKNMGRSSFDIKNPTTGILPNLLVYGAVAFLLMKQPDFGSTFLLGLVLMAMLFVAGLSWRYIGGALLLALVGAVAAIAAAPYRLARLTSYLDPWADIKKGGFQIIQSYLAFHNGGFLGLGLGESRQKLFFLPEAHTDFILAVLGEELGFLGVSFLCLCFAVYCYLGFQIAFLQVKPFRRYLAFGLTATTGFQGLFNMGVAMGLLPTKGIPLPFISSGASSLLVSLISTALLYRLTVHESKPPSQRQPA